MKSRCCNVAIGAIFPEGWKALLAPTRVKNCSKCGTGFQKYWGTNLVKGRSHCRTCSLAVCGNCHVVVNKAIKVCTRCLVKQKEDELSTQKALSAIGEAKMGRANSTSSSITDSFVMASPVLYMSLAQKKESLFEAAKSDENKNTPLFFAAEGGHLPCLALLMERNADVTTVNNKSWTSLHALA
ncbi:hypothetical protein P5673_004374 [Acropora cervicornis]|uniref:Uncharacterized protein n=1 Tax=Acropora cervicornis TaxID=6130 RepID=A0AAD9R0C9_ACRCE|nr:hypothetical protein P5673_004374 [Acropora cervicornis]